ncbi:hypothetical protein OAJ07_00680 [Gemmatimonadales bacterium]|nr:hypothetical protein [Gemmatimonadales bacterium]
MIRNAILKLGRTPRDINRQTLWRALSVKDRQRALTASLKTKGAPENFQEQLRVAIARGTNHREKALRKWDPKRVAMIGAVFVDLSPELIDQVLISFHLAERSEILAAYLDGVGIEHKEGRLVGAIEDLEPVSADQAKSVSADLLDHHEHEAVLVYLFALHIIHEKLCPDLGNWLHEILAKLTEDDLLALKTDEEDEAEINEEAEALETSLGFTKLDELLIRSIVDTVGEVDGARTIDDLDDILEELEHLSSDRHTTFFHLGFTDVLLGRELRTKFAVENPSRWRWYYSGAISGFARLETYDRIAALYDQKSLVRDLATRRELSDGADRVGISLFRALVHAGRVPEAEKAVSVEAVMRSTALLQEFFLTGKRLLREDRNDEAGAIMGKLVEATSRLKSEGRFVPEGLYLEARRRQAHCARAAGEFGKAEKILMGLLEDEERPGLMSMIQADLGLVFGQFKSLAEVFPPSNSDQLDAMADSIERGRGWFDAASRSDDRRSSHGRYCLGVLDVCRRDWNPATRKLTMALAQFEAHPDRYETRGLLDKARLLTAIAMACNIEDSPRPGRIVELVKQATSNRILPPPYLVGDFLESCEFHGQAEASEVFNALWGAAEPNTPLFGKLIRSEAGKRSAAVATHLLEQGKSSELSRGKRARNLRSAIPQLLEFGRPDDVAEALDLLEGMALQGTASAEYAELIESEEHFDSVWTPQEAAWSRVSILDSLGRTAEARHLLHDEFFRVVSRQDFGFLQEAEGITDRLELMGATEELIHQLRRRLDAQRERDDPEGVQHSASSVSILFVSAPQPSQAVKDQVEALLNDSRPDSSVHFISTEWGGNWVRHLDDVTRLLRKVDAIALSRLVRTRFGQKVRKKASEFKKPWVHCPGQGTKQIANSVLTAADWGHASQ